MKTTVAIKIIFLSRSADQASEDLDNPNFTFDLGRGPHEKVLPVADVASSLYIIMYFFIVILSYFKYISACYIIWKLFAQRFVSRLKAIVMKRQSRYRNNLQEFCAAQQNLHFVTRGRFLFDMMAYGLHVMSQFCAKLLFSKLYFADGSAKRKGFKVVSSFFSVMA